MFGAPDGFLREERRVHGFASESGFRRGNGEVASSKSRVVVEGKMFVKFGANLEDSDQHK